MTFSGCQFGCFHAGRAASDDYHFSGIRCAAGENFARIIVLKTRSRIDDTANGPVLEEPANAFLVATDTLGDLFNLASLDFFYPVGLSN